MRDHYSTSIYKFPRIEKFQMAISLQQVIRTTFCSV